MKRTISILAALALAALAAGVAGASSRSPRFDPPKRYYLALGDSVAYGYQQPKVDAGLPASAFDTGYVDDFAARLRRIRPRISVVDYGCPQESTSSFIKGPCPQNALGFPLHAKFSGSQLHAAIGFLHAHRGQVSPITLTLGGKDIGDFADACGNDLTCIKNGAPAEIRAMAANLRTILARLSAAAPDAEIIVTGAWDGFVDSFAAADPLFEALNSALAGVVADARARFADTFGVFNPQGDPASEKAAICRLTLTCSDDDGHPSDAGYRAIANVVYDASGYRRLSASRR